MAAAEGGLWLGLMSGTSLDGVDACAVRLREGEAAGRRVQVVAQARLEFAPGLRQRLLDLGEARGDSLDSTMRAEQELTRAYAQAVELLRGGLPDEGDMALAGLGSMGQTVRHLPRGADGGGLGYSAQLLDGALLAALTGLEVVCDLRRSDIAAGGHGAPLACAWHRWAFGGGGGADGQDGGRPLAVANLGGIANVTLLGRRDLGFDTGPANILMDGWIQERRGLPMDEDGAWAAQGRPIPQLLECLLAEPYLALPPPKTTGRELFNQAWLQARLQEAGQSDADPADVQCTLAHFTAASLAQALRGQGCQDAALYLCGGGARNPLLLQLLQEQLPEAQVQTTAGLGLDAGLVECSCAAWYAWMRLHDRPCDLRDFTGARRPAIMGAHYRPPQA